MTRWLAALFHRKPRRFASALGIRVLALGIYTTTISGGKRYD